MAERRADRLTEVKLGCIGAGSMGGALLQGLLAGGMPPGHLTFFDPDSQRTPELEAAGLEAALDNAEVMHSQVVVLAVKPQVIGRVLQEIRQFVRPWHLIISIAAGVTLARLEEVLPDARVIRAMPNAPLAVREGMTAVAAGSRATSEDLALAVELFQALGRAVPVEEKDLDAVTAVSGSGAGFAAVFLEALADGGVRAGLSRPLALELAAQTLAGVGRLCLAQDLHPAVLKDRVASPGGTTMAGLHALEMGGFRGLVMDAVTAATFRAKELAG